MAGARSRREGAEVQRLLEGAVARLAAAGVDTPRLDAELLLAHALGLSRAALHADPRRRVGAREGERFWGAVERRARREPLAYIVGEREFWSLSLTVDRRVLVPRPETETLVEVCLELLPTGERGPALDVGTGSGAVAIALARERPELVVWATEPAAELLAVARANAVRHGVEGRVRLVVADLLGPFRPGSVALVAANPPYVPSGALAALVPEVRDHEPRRALDGGPEGLAVIRRLALAAAALLRPGGHLALEVGSGQAGKVGEIVTEAGLGEVRVARDLAGIERVVAARARGRP